MTTLVAAWDENRLIGNGNKLPWHISDDLKHFKKLTANGVILMGRKTWESIGCKPLPKRKHMIITSEEQQNEDGVYYFKSVDDALNKMPQIFIAGGRQIYDYVLKNNLVDRMIISKIKGKYKGDTYFPEFDENDWEVKIIENYKQFDVFEYKRIKNASH